MVHLSRDAGQWQGATAPTQPCHHESKQPILFSVLCCQSFLDIVFSYPIMSTKCLFESPASVRRRGEVNYRCSLTMMGVHPDNGSVLSTFKAD